MTINGRHITSRRCYGLALHNESRWCIVLGYELDACMEMKVLLTRPAGDVAERNRIRGTKRNAIGSRAPRLPPEIAPTATAYYHVESTPPPPYKSFVRPNLSLHLHVCFQLMDPVAMVRHRLLNNAEALLTGGLLAENQCEVNHDSCTSSINDTEEENAP